VLGIGLTLSGTGLLRPATAEAARLWNPTPAGEPEQVQDILDILATNEAFGVTLVGTILDNVAKGNYNPAIPPLVVKILTGVRAQEQFHLDFLKGAGAKLRTETFHIEDTTIFANPMALFKDLVELEDAAIAAVMASLHTFTREQRIDLIKANFSQPKKRSIACWRTAPSACDRRTTTPSRRRSSARWPSSMPDSSRRASSAVVGCRSPIQGPALSIRPT